MIKFSKNLLFNPAKIQAFGIRCSFNNIAKILNAFNCKWAVVTIDSAAEGSTLLTFIKNQGLECFTKPRADGCLEVSAVIQYSSLEEFLNKAIDEEPENIFVLCLRDPANSAMCLQHSYEKLVIAGIADVFISISLDESAFLICMNKALVSPQDIYARVKALRLN